MEVKSGPTQLIKELLMFFALSNKSTLLRRALESRSLKVGGKMWMKTLKFLIQRSFKKIRIGQVSQNKNIKIQKQIDAHPQNEEEIEKEISANRKNTILNQLSSLKNENNDLNRISLWKLKQKICPNVPQTIALAKLNSRSELVSNRKELLSLYKDEYIERLSHRKISPKYETLKQLKENLFDLRLSLSKLPITRDWTYNQLYKVMRSLKVNKSRDSSGLIYEIFKPGVAGVDLSQSLLDLLNRMKSECEVPQFIKEVRITFIYKHTGNMADIRNERGIF